MTEAGSDADPHWRTDARIDVGEHFDLQLFYFPHDVPRDMGGPMFLPGSQYRRVSNPDISRYQHFVGQMPVVCKAGTVIVTHHGLWHRDQPNRTDQPRAYLTARISAGSRQVLTWNTDDLHEPGATDVLHKNHIWYGVEDRLEIINRIRMWRLLIDDPEWDTALWLTRVENEPTTRVAQ